MVDPKVDDHGDDFLRAAWRDHLESDHLVAGLPSSSSHALIGGFCGAALATAGNDWSVLKWRTGI